MKINLRYLLSRDSQDFGLVQQLKMNSYLRSNLTLTLTHDFPNCCMLSPPSECWLGMQPGLGHLQKQWRLPIKNKIIMNKRLSKYADTTFKLDVWPWPYAEVKIAFVIRCFLLYFTSYDVCGLNSLQAMISCSFCSLIFSSYFILVGEFNHFNINLSIFFLYIAIGDFIVCQSLVLNIGICII